MATVFVVQTGLWVASGIVALPLSRPDGSLVPRRANWFWAHRRMQAAGEAMSKIQLYFFIGGSSFYVGKNALSSPETQVVCRTGYCWVAFCELCEDVNTFPGSACQRLQFVRKRFRRQP